MCMNLFPSTVPAQDEKGHHTHHLAQEHSAGLKERMVEAPLLSVHALGGHGVGPFDAQGVDGAGDQHERGQAKVEPIHDAQRRRLSPLVSLFLPMKSPLREKRP